MKILQIINALTWGGAQVLVLDLCRFLIRSGHDVKVASFRDGPVGDSLRQEGIEVHVLSEKMLDSIAFTRLSGLVRQFSPDVIHTHLFRATFWGRLAGKLFGGAALVTSIHGVESPFYSQLERRLVPLSSRVIFPSRYLQNWYAENIRKIPEGKNLLLYPGAPIYPLSGNRETVSGLRVGTLSRLHPVKGLDTFIDACFLLKEKGISMEILIGGEGKDQARLEERAARKGFSALELKFVGNPASAQSFLESLDLFVAPSREEAFGITVCEAMERGLPVVGASVGGIREIIEPGSNGLLFESGNVDELANALETLIRDSHLRLGLGKNARERIKGFFSRDTWLKGHLDLYAGLAAKKYKKVHVAISSGELGGGERMGLSLAGGLKRRGWEVTATCGGEPLLSKLRETGIPAAEASMKCGGLFWAMKLAGNIQQWHPRLVHAHLNKASLISSLLKPILGKAVVAHVHGLNRASYYQRCDGLLAVSASVRDHLLAQGISPELIKVLPNAIDKRPVSGTREPGKPWTIAIPAKLHKNKGHAWALEAMEKAGSNLPEFNLWIFGEGPEKEALQARFQQGRLAQSLKFWGFQPEMDAFYPRIDVVLLPSLGEGIPLSLLEAMRWGIPIVATNVGGIPEIVSPGSNGLLIEPGNETQLIQALAEVLSAEVWRGYSSRAVEAFRRFNSFDRLVDILEQVLLEKAG